MLKAGIVGATGYTGVELARSLFNHSEVDLVYIAADSTAGSSFSKLYPQLSGRIEIIAEKYDIGNIKKQGLDVIFLALPHGASMSIVPELISTDIRIIDLGADFRLDSTDDYLKWYQLDHICPELLSQAVYGLPEKYREKIKNAELVANPGCYTTAANIAIWPLSEQGIINGNVIIDAKSGISGAGKKCSPSTHFCSADEGLMAYKVLTHQHTAEIMQESDADIIMIPHLTPMIRGIMSTIYVPVKNGVTEENIRDIYLNKYSAEPFTRILDTGIVLSTKMVSGSNNCYIQVYFDQDRNIVVITSVIDNLIKGASGQAVQNMNIMFGFEETTGLSQIALYP